MDGSHRSPLRGAGGPGAADHRARAGRRRQGGRSDACSDDEPATDHGSRSVQPMQAERPGRESARNVARTGSPRRERPAASTGHEGRAAAAGDPRIAVAWRRALPHLRWCRRRVVLPRKLDLWDLDAARTPGSAVARRRNEQSARLKAIGGGRPRSRCRDRGRRGMGTLLCLGGDHRPGRRGIESGLRRGGTSSVAPREQPESPCAAVPTDTSRYDSRRTVGHALSYLKARLAAGLRVSWTPEAGFEPASLQWTVGRSTS